MIQNLSMKDKFLFYGCLVASFCVGVLLSCLIIFTGSRTSNLDQNGQEWCSASRIPSYQNKDNKYSSDKWINEKENIQKLIDRTDSLKIKENLRYLTKEPHIAGSQRDNELAEYIRKAFRDAGFDEADLVPYDLLLSKPDMNNPNKGIGVKPWYELTAPADLLSSGQFKHQPHITSLTVRVTLMRNKEVIFESNHKEKAIHPDDPDPNFIPAFIAFSPAASLVTNPGVGVVYVNYGRTEDFEELEQLGVDVQGHIAIVRYGKIFRGNKVQNAQRAGATGILIFSDPEQVAPEGTKAENVYDNSWWLPGTGMESGTAFLEEGDPLTPLWPSTEHAYRLDVHEVNLPNIPSQPLGYSDARVLLEMLDGPNVPLGWQGGLKNLTYKLGPTFLPEFSDVNIKFSTHNAEKIERSYNVIGIIKGSIEPDRYVIFGNHRDAWGYGASDPSSGTAQLLETARVYGTLLKEGWRPRRTLVFCSWTAEEYGLFGSTEWVEEHINKLQARSVAYINVDMCVSGPKLYIDASPMLWDVFHNVTAMIPGVQNSSRTIFDEWKEYFEELEPEAEEKPVMQTLASGSDYAPFTVLAGIPSADIWYRRDGVKYNISTYPYYHTGYETFYMVSTFVDPDFKIHQGCGRIVALALKYLADSTIIPYSIYRYPVVMKKLLLENKHRATLKKIYNKYDELEKSVDRFIEATERFQIKISTQTDFMGELQIRSLNDQIMKLEQNFIIPEGLPGRPTTRHAIFASSQFDDYASASFPGLTDLLYKFDILSGEAKILKKKEIKRHISDLTIMIDRATSSLKETYLI